MQLIRATLALALVTCGAGAAVLACESSAADPGASSGGGGAGNDAAQVSNTDGGGPGPGADGGGGGDGGVPDGTGTALITVTQLVTPSVTELGIGAYFSAKALNVAACTTTTLGGCIATSCPNVMGVSPRASLNAGAITLTGTGPSSPTTLTFGPEGDSGVNGYSHLQTQTRFYNDGDTLSVSGAGGPDLPAFAAQTIVAPNDIVVTSPACADVVCPDFARSADATISWTGGGAGKVMVTFITTTDVGTKSLSCSFDATAGTGTVPTAALMLIDPGSAAGYYGVEYLSPIDTKTFTVGTLPVSFQVQGSPIEGSFTTTD